MRSVVAATRAMTRYLQDMMDSPERVFDDARNTWVTVRPGQTAGQAIAQARLDIDWTPFVPSPKRPDTAGSERRTLEPEPTHGVPTEKLVSDHIATPHESAQPTGVAVALPLSKAGDNPFATALWIFGVLALIIGLILIPVAAGMSASGSTHPGTVAFLSAAGSVLLTSGFFAVIGALVLSGVRWVLERLPR